MTRLDWIVVAAYLLSTLGLSAWLARRQETAADYYVGGRTLPWWALTMDFTIANPKPVPPICRERALSTR